MSKNIQLANDETQIASLDGAKGRQKSSIALTSQRIYQVSKASGSEDLRMIPLNRSDSYGIVTKQSILLLILGIITLPLYGVGLLVLLVWWLTRKTTFVVNSISGELQVSAEVSSSNRQHVVAFIHDVHSAYTKNCASA